MTESARKLLEEFESLDRADKQQVAVEILRRSSGTVDLPDSAFAELADEVFQGYDAEESAGAAN